MRVIFSWLALAQRRLGLWQVERSRMLDRQSEEAIQRGEEHMRLASALAARAGMSRR